LISLNGNVDYHRYLVSLNGSVDDHPLLDFVKRECRRSPVTSFR